jgi:hypothetical protein
VFNYAENEPIGSIDLWGLQRVRVHSQILTSAQLGGGIKGRIVSLFDPRHAYLEIQAKGENLLLELGGPQNGSSKGTPFRKSYDYKDHRKDQVEHRVIRPNGLPEGGGDYSFENKILRIYEVLINDLPDYNGLGPNSNGFISSIILLAGGEADLIFEHGTLFGAEAENLTPYFKAYFKAYPEGLSAFKERISNTVSTLKSEGEALRNKRTFNKRDVGKAAELSGRIEFYEGVQEQLDGM